MIFLTVGTEFPFDRLVRAVDEMVGDSALTEEVFAQIGQGEYRPRHISWERTLESSVYNQRMDECSAVISHAGMGTIIRCMELHKPLLVMPRLKRYREHVNDHQVATARRLESLGRIVVAYNTQDLRVRMNDLHTFRPGAQRAETHLIVDCIKGFLSDLSNEKSKNMGSGLFNLTFKRIVRGVERQIDNIFFMKLFPLWQSLGFHVSGNDYYDPIPDTRTLRNELWRRFGDGSDRT